MSDIFLSIIIPAYNEAARIGPTLTKISTYFSDKKYSFEVIVVNDGSTDETGINAKQSSRLFKNFFILENAHNVGKGHATKRGFEKARGAYRLFMDADGSVDISHLDIFLKHIDRADIIIGSIEVPGAYNKDRNAWYRRPLGKLSKILVRTLAIPGIYDTQRGFKLFSHAAASALFPYLTTRGWGFDIELIARAQARGLRIIELPVRWINPESQSLSLKSFWSTFIEFLKIEMHIVRKSYVREKTL